MDTIVIKTVLKIIKRFVGILLLTTVLACPGEDDCFDIGRSNYIESLIVLSPELVEYNQGDIVTLNLSIPSLNNYFGEQVDLFNETNDDLAKLITSTELFLDNSINIITGSEANSINRFYMPYNPSTESYELEIVITLERLGEYSFFSSESIEFIGNGCDRFVLDTNIDWNYTNGKIEFTVIE